MTKAAEHEIQELILSCTRARRQLFSSMIDDETSPALTIAADMPVFGGSADHYVHAADGYLSKLVDLVDVVDVFSDQCVGTVTGTLHCDTS